MLHAAPNPTMRVLPASFETKPDLPLKRNMREKTQPSYILGLEAQMHA